MPDELRALFAAIVADPADDTARLAYADCLQEHGNTARADFIRLQIEAERLHPDSNARARLEEKAQALFAEHWIEWWSEVCAAIGFPMPVPKPRGRLGRIVRRVPVVNPPGYPYFPSQSSIELRTFNFGFDARVAGLRQATFHRGFPDTLQTYVPLESPHGIILTRWVAEIPLIEASVPWPFTKDWINGPHMSSLRRLTLEVFDAELLISVLASPHLAQLEELSLIPPHSEYEYSRDQFNELNRTMEEGLSRVLCAPLMRRLKRLSIPLWSNRAAEALARSENLARLEELELEMYPSPLYDVELLVLEDTAAEIQRLASLARSSHLMGVRELRVIGGLDEAGVEAIVRNPVWTRLRKLDLQMEWQPGNLELLTQPNGLSELDELRLAGVSYSVAQIEAFARSPLLKRLRHFAVRGGPYHSVNFDIAHAVDPDRIETFAIGEKELQTSVAEKLQKHFGDRFRVLR